MSNIKRFDGTEWKEVAIDADSLRSSNSARPSSINSYAWKTPLGMGKGGYLEYVTAVKYNATGNPCSDDGCLINLGWDNGSWASQIFASQNESSGCDIYTRCNVGTAGSWTDWKRLAFANADDLNAMINCLSVGASTPTDSDYLITQYVGGGTSTTTYHRRPFSTVWSYIKSKADAKYTPLQPALYYSYGNESERKGLIIHASDHTERAGFTWSGNTAETDSLTISTVFGGIALNPNVSTHTEKPIVSSSYVRAYLFQPIPNEVYSTTSPEFMAWSNGNPAVNTRTNAFEICKAGTSSAILHLDNLNTLYDYYFPAKSGTFALTDDLSSYATKTYVDSGLAAKQDALTITGKYLNGSEIETEESKRSIYSKKAVDSLFVTQDGLSTAISAKLTIATESKAGVVKLGSGDICTKSVLSPSTTDGRTYPVQRNGDNQLVVTVPWMENDAAIATSTIMGVGYIAAATHIDGTGYSTHGVWRDPNTGLMVCFGTTGSISGSGNNVTFKTSFKGAPEVTVTPFFKSTSETSIGTQYRNAATVRCYLVSGSSSASYSSSSEVTGFVLDTGNSESQYFNYVAIGRYK